MQAPGNKLALQLIEKARKENATRLDLGNCGLTELPEELLGLADTLEELTLTTLYYNIEKLHYTGSNHNVDGGRNNIQNYSLLENLPNLRMLSLYVHPDYNLSPLGKLDKLTHLQVFGNIIDVHWFSLSKLTSLTIFVLSGMARSGISPIEHFRNLKTLILDCSFIRNVSPLKNLKKLETLLLSEIDSQQLGAFSQIKSLQTLIFGSDKELDLAPLNQLPNLKLLGLEGPGIQNLAPIEPLIRRLPVKIGLVGEGEAGAAAEGIFIAPDTSLQIPPLEIVGQGSNAILAYFDSLKKEAEAKTGSRNIANANMGEDDATDGVMPEKPLYEPTNEVKLIVVGNSTCGKTTLVKYLLNNRSISEKHDSTHGMEQHIWEYKPKIEGLERKLNIRIYDFGGQEYYHDTHHLFFSQNAIFLLVWEQGSDQYGKLPTKIRINGEEAELDLEHFDKTYWLSAIQHFTSKGEELWQHILEMAERSREAGDPLENVGLQQPISKFTQQRVSKRLLKTGRQVPTPSGMGDSQKPEVINETPEKPPTHRERKLNAPILVIQNKIDLHGIQAVNQANLNEFFPNVYDYCAISLYRKGPRRLKVMKEIFHEMLANTKIVGSVMTDSWEAVKSKLEEKPESKPLTMSFEAFTEFCMEQSPLMEESYVEVIAKWLHETGTLLYFHEDEDLKLTVFTNPQKLTEKIYRILSQEVAKQGGIFKKEHIHHALGCKEFDETCQTLLDLMLHKKIVFERGEGVYVAPQYLPEMPDAQVQIFISVYTQILYRYNFKGFLHRNVLLEVFAKYGRLAKVDETKSKTHHHYWRNGMVLSKDNNFLLIEFDRARAYINLKVQPNSGTTTDTKLVKEVLEAFAAITKNKAELTVSADNENFVPLEMLQKAAEGEGNEMMVRWGGQVFHLSKFNQYIKYKFKLYKVFISYAAQDEAYREQLEKHLAVMQRMGFVDTWHDRKLLPGEDINAAKSQHLQEADIILLLISPDFLASNYIWYQELRQATESTATVIPIILRPCMLSQIESIKKLSMLPHQKGEKAISQYNNADEAWKEVMEGIFKLMSK